MSMKKLGLLIIPLLMCFSCENEKITIYAGEKANKCFNLEEQGYSSYLSFSTGLYGTVSLEEENISATFSCTKGEFLNTRFQVPLDEKSFLWTTQEVDQPDNDNYTYIDVSFVFIERIVDAMPTITSKPYTYYEFFGYVSFSFEEPITIAKFKSDYLANCSYYGGLNVDEIFSEYQNEKETTKLDDSYIIDKDQTLYPSKDFRFTIHAV